MTAGRILVILCCSGLAACGGQAASHPSPLRSASGTPARALAAATELTSSAPETAALTSGTITQPAAGLGPFTGSLPVNRAESGSGLAQPTTAASAQHVVSVVASQNCSGFTVTVNYASVSADRLIQITSPDGTLISSKFGYSGSGHITVTGDYPQNGVFTATILAPPFPPGTVESTAKSNGVHIPEGCVKPTPTPSPSPTLDPDVDNATIKYVCEASGNFNVEATMDSPGDIGKFAATNVAPGLHGTLTFPLDTDFYVNWDTRERVCVKAVVAVVPTPASGALAATAPKLPNTGSGPTNPPALR